MATTLYKTTSYPLRHLIEDIKRGSIALPSLQRAFVWKPSQVRDLFDSLYRGYPVGTLLFWETDHETSTRAIEADTVNGLPQRLIIDGQQRLTSLYTVLTKRPIITEDLRETIIQIAFRPHDETFEVSDTVTERSPEFLPDIRQLWTDDYRSVIRNFLTNLADHRGTSLLEDERNLLEDRIYQLRDIENFPLQALGVEFNHERGAGRRDFRTHKLSGYSIEATRLHTDPYVGLLGGWSP